MKWKTVEVVVVVVCWSIPKPTVLVKTNLLKYPFWDLCFTLKGATKTFPCKSRVICSLLRIRQARRAWRRVYICHCSLVCLDIIVPRYKDAGLATVQVSSSVGHGSENMLGAWRIFFKVEHRCEAPDGRV